jgi:hypothetical protein
LELLLAKAQAQRHDAMLPEPAERLIGQRRRMEWRGKRWRMRCLLKFNVDGWMPISLYLTQLTKWSPYRMTHHYLSPRNHHLLLLPW